MSKQLERDLGLYATFTISIGAMIGSGIFVLPGLAAKIGGPAVIFAYYLAGVVALPAALSKSEMATAMPEAGGTYLYIDRAMGPLMGTIAGVGAWFSLVFKSAFALVGLGAYLLVIVSLPDGLVTVIALGLAILLLVVNVFGVKQTGRLQAGIVTLVLLALGVFVANGVTNVDNSHFEPFFTTGSMGVLAATGFVFVSYAGVTKIASVAEEVENPGRNIPIGILASIVFMMHVYTAIAFVIVGVSPFDTLTTTLTPMALAATQLFGDPGALAIATVAVLALTSMANAGILSSTRFPLAMSRDSLAPPSLGEIHATYRTPVYSILFTGGILVLLIAFVPVVELAKLASAFQILVFSLENTALVAFRESDLQSYQPEFTAPGYPYVQLFGIGAGLLLITQMGIISIVGAIGIIAGGYVWYRVYGRERTAREGAALEAIRQTTDRYSVRNVRELFATGGDGGILIGVGPETTAETTGKLLELAKPIAARRGGTVNLVRFEEVPEQVPLSAEVGEFRATDEAFEREAADLASDFQSPVEIGEVVAHDIEHAVANYVTERQVNLVIGEWQPEFFQRDLGGYDVDWYMRNVEADFVFVRENELERVDDIALVGERGPFSPLQVMIGDAIAGLHDADLHLYTAKNPDASPGTADRIQDYHETIMALCSAECNSRVRTDVERDRETIEAVESSDLIITSTSAHHLIHDVIFGSLPDRLVEELDATVVLVHANEPRRHTFIRHLLQRYVF